MLATLQNDKIAVAFLTELGSEFFVLLLEHLRKYTISDAGAVVLRKYCTTAACF